ncbi:hypothetical protein FQA39_LY01795 [Lamprigera yunnana]|nr:hypothetical protein FQA39_LY01795 [Lamprigera yunnana]
MLLQANQPDTQDEHNKAPRYAVKKANWTKFDKMAQEQDDTLATFTPKNTEEIELLATKLTTATNPMEKPMRWWESENQSPKRQGKTYRTSQREKEKTFKISKKKRTQEGIISILTTQLQSTKIWADSANTSIMLHMLLPDDEPKDNALQYDIFIEQITDPTSNTAET